MWSDKDDLIRVACPVYKCMLPIFYFNGTLQLPLVIYALDRTFPKIARSQSRVQTDGKIALNSKIGGKDTSSQQVRSNNRDMHITSKNLKV